MSAETEMKAMTFIQAFTELQVDAAAINKKNGFSTTDPLIDEFEQWFVNAALDGTNRGDVKYALSYQKFRSLFSDMRNARVGLKLMLSVSELGETLEAVRKNLGPDSHIPDYTSEEAEVADAVIRLMNYATDRKLRLAEAIFAKNEYNRTRDDHSQAARAAENGKKF